MQYLAKQYTYIFEKSHQSDKNTEGAHNFIHLNENRSVNRKSCHTQTVKRNMKDHHV